jgi:hypothetical protein
MKSSMEKLEEADGVSDFFGGMTGSLARTTGRQQAP